jgi:hypothetical protein
MTDGAGDSFTLRYRPAISRWVALGWCAALAIIYLMYYHGWERPATLVALGAQTLPGLAVGGHFAPFWRERLWDFGWCGAVLATAFPVGAILARYYTYAKDLLTGLYALALGLTAVAVGVLALGLWRVEAVGWVFLLAGAWFSPEPRAFFRKTSGSANSGWCWVMWCLLGVAGLLGWLSACTPPFEYDELEYHLGAPTEYIRAGRILFLPHNFYSNLPQLTEMLYLLGLVTRSDIAPKMLHWMLGGLAGVATYAVATRLWSHRVGLTAAALFYVTPFVLDLSQTARIDLATTFFATLAFGGVLLAYDGDRWLWFGALLAGAAVATKWTAIPVVLAPAAVFVLVARRSVWTMLAFGLLAVVPVLPWLAKNWWLTGDPIYPLATINEHWTVAQADLFAQKHYATFDAAGLAAFFERPWHYSFGEWNAVPVLLMTVPLVALTRDNARVRRALWLGLAIYLGWYGCTFRPWRFLFPAFPLAAAIAAYGLHAVGRWARWVVVAVLLAGVATMALTLLVDAENPERVPPTTSPAHLLLGQLSTDEFLGRLGQGMFAPILWMNQNLPAHARVLYIGEARIHHARHPVLWATAFDRHPITRADLKQLGVTHVYVNFSEWRRLTENYDYLLDFDKAGFRRLLQDPEKARLIFDRDRYKVWELIR